MLLAFKSKLLAPLVAPMVLLIFHGQIRPTSAIFNCFTPNMFKMGKVGAPSGAYGQHSGERANWYPQAQQKQYYPNYYPGYYGESPMKMLFRPKWGSSLFGPRKWMDWRMGANTLQRPAYGGYMSPVAQTFIQPAPTSSGYPQQQQQQRFPAATFNDQLLNLPAFPGRQPSGSNLNSPDLYSQQQLGNDGWSVPFNQQQINVRPSQQQQQQPFSYDSYSVSPGSQASVYPMQSTKGQQQQQQFDNYGTKGGSSRQQYNTTKNILVADGGYDSYDAHLMNYDSRRRPPPPRPNNHWGASSVNSLEAGYSYPDWYSGSVDSPAKIAQQVYKLQRRRTMMGGI